ncbi:MAG: PfkB family carbohydrate kinase [Humidesulfovibrio sp.]|nr:PfkB family carbohydrate kinase [Humidesulfovibrio sp.]
MNQEKLVPLVGLTDMFGAARAEGKEIVLAYGGYDYLHIGHIRHLRQARALGCKLVVVLAPDSEIKRCSLPVPQAMRAEALTHLDFVDHLCTDAPDLRAALMAIRPDIYAVMAENDGPICGEDEQALCAELGIELVKTGGVSFDSTMVINQSMASYSDEAREYLRLFKTRFGLDDVRNTLDAMSGLKVAVVGDTIIDEYCFCSPLGASSKDPILALRYQSNDVFAGGIVAVANHVASFAAHVDMFTVLGDRNSHEDFIRKRLKPNVRPVFAVQKDSPTVLKRRYVEGYTQNKLFEIYFMEDIGLDVEADAAFRATLEAALPNYDMVIVADFGHGAVSPATRKLLAQSAPFLALNAQANSGNRGFHTVTKYSRADYISIAEHEVRLEMRDMRGPMRPMIDHLAPRLSCSNFVVTRGKRGSLIRCKSGQHIEVPAFARKIVDRVGAGDAFLSVTAMAARLDAPPELLCFIGNLVGALAVEILGNQKSIDKASVKEYAANLLA